MKPPMKKNKSIQQVMRFEDELSRKKYIKNSIMDSREPSLLRESAIDSGIDSQRYSIK